MSINGNTIAFNSKNESAAYVYEEPPESDFGNDGDYYFYLNIGMGSISEATWSSSSENNGGWEFTATDYPTILGVRGYSRVSESGKIIKLGTTSGTVIKEVSIDLIAGKWVDVYFEEPFYPEEETNYVIKINTTGLCYIRNPVLTTNEITYIRGRYGSSMPGSSESNVCYSVDLLIEKPNPPYTVAGEYYKSNGTWTEVT